MDLPTWTTNAINLSSMALKPAAVRGNGYRRDYTQDPNNPTWTGRPNILINANDQGVYIFNPFYMNYQPTGTSINISGIGQVAINGPPVGQRPPEDKTFPVTYPTTVSITSTTAGSMDAPQVPAAGKDPILYIQWGYDRMSRASLNKTLKVTDLYAFCNGFTCLSIAILSQPTYYMNNGNKIQNPIAAGTLIEAVSCTVTTTSNSRMSHIFCVVNRNPDPTGTDIKNPANWGNDCFVVDQWYGLQIYQCPLPGTNVGAVQTVFRVSNIHNQPEATYFAAIQGGNGGNALKSEGQFKAREINIQRPSDAAKNVSAVP